jgi:natural product precursor
MKKFQKISEAKFNQISEDQLSSITGGALAIELTDIRDTPCGCGGSVTDARID